MVNRHVRHHGLHENSGGTTHGCTSIGAAEHLSLRLTCRRPLVRQTVLADRGAATGDILADLGMRPTPAGAATPASPGAPDDDWPGLAAIFERVLLPHSRP
jgi:hypothetical protein